MAPEQHPRVVHVEEALAVEVEVVPHEEAVPAGGVGLPGQLDEVPDRTDVRGADGEAHGAEPRTPAGPRARQAVIADSVPSAHGDACRGVRGGGPDGGDGVRRGDRRPRARAGGRRRPGPRAAADILRPARSPGRPTRWPRRAPRSPSTSPSPRRPARTCAGARPTACTPWSARPASRRPTTTTSAKHFVRSNCLVAPELRHRRGADDALRRAGGAVLRHRRGDRAAPRRQGRRTVGHRHDDGAAHGRGVAGLGARSHQARGASRAPGAARPTAGIHVHSVRLRGLVAHQEVLLGTTGQSLTHPPRLLRPHLVHARRAAGGEEGRPSAPASPSASTPSSASDTPGARERWATSARQGVANSPIARRSGPGGAGYRQAVLVPKRRASSSLIPLTPAVLIELVHPQQVLLGLDVAGEGVGAELGFEVGRGEDGAGAAQHGRRRRRWPRCPCRSACGSGPAPRAGARSRRSSPSAPATLMAFSSSMVMPGADTFGQW